MQVYLYNKTAQVKASDHWMCKKVSKQFT